MCVYALLLLHSELITRFREKGSECDQLQQQLREARGHETSLQQSMVGLRAEMQALVEENDCLLKALATCEQEAQVMLARATNAEVSSFPPSPLPPPPHPLLLVICILSGSVAGCTAVDSTAGGRE